MHIVQFADEAGKRRVGIVAEDRIFVLSKVTRTVDLARLAIKNGDKLATAAKKLAGSKSTDYAAALKEKRVLAPVDHPDPAHCIVTGTGLTHLGSAAARDNMHKKLEGKAEELTDSLKMFKLGLEGGKPAKGKAGVQPEWFYKGDGSWLKGPGDLLERPAYALDGGEEPEVAGIYFIADDGRPWRLGFALGNEYSDHVMERQNYLYLAHSKLRQSAIGPELHIGALPAHVEGMSRIHRQGRVVWEKPFLTGEANMSHTIGNLEYHHFKYDAFRRPGDLHVHYFGTGTLSIADGFKTETGDEFEIDVPAFGKPLRNRLKIVADRYKPSGLKSL
jgi:hypothetical protein